MRAVAAAGVLPHCSAAVLDAPTMLGEADFLAARPTGIGDASAPVLGTGSGDSMLEGLVPRRQEDAVGSLSALLDERDADGDLERWLSTVEFNITEGMIPPAVFDVKVIITIKVELRVKMMVCTGLRIGTLHGAGRGVAREAAPGSWGASAEDLAVRCSVTVAYEAPALGPVAKGEADATLNTTAGKLSVQLDTSSTDKPPMRVPDSISTTRCTSELALDLDVAGDGWAWLERNVPSVTALLKDYMNKEIDKVVCGEALTAVTQQANAFLSKAHDHAWKFMQAPEPEEPPTDPSNVAWQNVPVVEWVRQFLDVAANYSALDRLLRFEYPGGSMCFIGSKDEKSDLCLWGTNPVCLFGSDAEPSCAIRRPVGGHDNHFRVEAQVFEGAFTDPSARLVADNATMRIGGASGDSRFRLRLGVKFKGTAGGAKADLAGTFELEAVLRRLRLEAALFAGLDRVDFDQVATYDYTKLQCLAPAFRDVRAFDMVARLPIEDANLTFHGSLASLSAEITGLAQDLLKSLLVEYGNAVDPLLLGMARELVLPTVNTAVQRRVARATGQACPVHKGHESDATHPALINPEKSKMFLGYAVSLAVVAAVATACAEAAHRLWRRLTRSGPQSASPQLVRDPGTAAPDQQPPAPNGVPPAVCRAAGDVDLGETVAGDGAAPTARRSCGGACCKGVLCLSLVVPWPLAVAIPSAIIALTFFLLGSNYMEAAVTFVTLGTSPRADDSYRETLMVAQTEIYEVMPFSLFYSIKKLRDDELPLLANVVWAFSGLLPYFKLAVMFASWVLPTAVLPTCARKWMLLAMDTFGKYSLVDVFVIQFISTALASSLDLGAALAPQGAPALEAPSVLLRTSQSVGFTAFVLATIGSLVIGHICLFCHHLAADVPASQEPARRDAASRDSSASAAARGGGAMSVVVGADNGADAGAGGARQSRRAAPAPTAPPQAPAALGPSGRTSADEAGSTGTPDYYQAGKGFGLGATLVLAMILVFVGCSITAFSVELVTPFGSLGKVEHCVFGLACVLPSFAEYPNSAATRFGQITFIVFGFAVMILHMSILCIFWFARIPKRFLIKAATISRTLFAWSALDVMALSMVITLLEMSTTNFVPLTHSQVRELEKVLHKTLPMFTKGLACNISLGAGTYVIGVAVVLHYVVSRPMMNMLDVAAADYRKAKHVQQWDMALISSRWVLPPTGGNIDGECCNAQAGLVPLSSVSAPRLAASGTSARATKIASTLASTVCGGAQDSAHVTERTEALLDVA